MKKEDNTLNILRLTFDLVEYDGLQSDLVLVFKENGKHGVITKYGEVLEEAKLSLDDIKSYKRKNIDVLEVTYSDTGYTKIFLLKDTGKAVEKKQIYRSKSFTIQRLLTNCIVLEEFSGDYGSIIIDYNGRRKSESKYLSVIEHKNTGDLICPRFLEHDAEKRKVVKYFDIFSSRCRVKHIKSNWTQEFIRKYFIAESLVFRRHTYTIEIKKERKKGRFAVYVDGMIDPIASDNINRYIKLNKY